MLVKNLKTLSKIGALFIGIILIVSQIGHESTFAELYSHTNIQLQDEFAR